MKKLGIVGVLLFSVLLNAQESKQVEYIRKYAKLAVQEMEQYKIPASITLAQGILESASGTSELAVNANNHFGIKCKGKEWNGDSYSKVSGEVYKGRRVNERSCFRSYNNIEDGYRDHSKFLAERPYYKSCFKLDITNYKGWASCLKRSGYATDPRYTAKLTDRIEKFNLSEFDKIKIDDVDKKIAELYGVDASKVPQIKEDLVVEVKEEKQDSVTEEVYKPIKEIVIEQREKHPGERIKKHPVGSKYIVLYEKDDLTTLSKQYDISVKKLVKYNDLEKNQALKANQNFFLQSKKTSGATKFYKVLDGETMHDVAQKNGIKLSKLYKRNRVKKGYQPKAGEVLNLQGKRKK